MKIGREKEALVLFVGDIAIFAISLYVTLFFRYRDAVSLDLFTTHLLPFGVLFLVWVLVFFTAGLYEKHTLVLKNKLPTVILEAHIINIIIAVLVFYFVPAFGIAPKTILFIYTVISSPLIVFWRVYGQELVSPSHKQNALIIGHGEEMKEIIEEVNNNSRYGFSFISSIDLNEIDSLDFQGEILSRIYSENIQVVVVDLASDKVVPFLPNLYNLIFSHVRFVDMHKLFEDMFDKVPLSLVRYNWFIENISLASRDAYDFLKRGMDILISIPLAVLSLLVYPFVWLAIKIEDGGKLLITQERVGRNNSLIHIYKFRSMTGNDQGNYGVQGKTQLSVTRVGKWLRLLRIDELPQLWNVLRGDISLIGPRPELPTLVKTYEKEIPFYGLRHLIQPGLSGWAQIYHEGHPHHGEAVEETKEKLSYDLYYLKNRSFFLDVKIALKTLKILMSRSGR